MTTVVSVTLMTFHPWNRAILCLNNASQPLKRTTLLSRQLKPRKFLKTFNRLYTMKPLSSSDNKSITLPQCQSTTEHPQEIKVLSALAVNSQVNWEILRIRSASCFVLIMIKQSVSRSSPANSSTLITPQRQKVGQASSNPANFT